MNVNATQRAKELHAKIKNTFARNQTTIAVGISTTDLSVIGTSDIRLRKEILDELTNFEIVATSKEGNHAEENVMDEADNLELTLSSIGVSRPICLECEEKIKSKKIFTDTPFSGKKSVNRK